ncbi:MAG TPA: histidine kinase dimerization/phosphoacceptor domain -containing protein [Caulobacteraceae bacterium]|nr:histidine kinase dimerization/phosphoacceptor domain -containing protein [Caulobacteraceae bacterium]
MAAHQPLHPEAALSLALAVIASSTAPVVLLDGDLTIVAASASFFRSFGIDPASAPDRPLFALGAGEWDVAQLRSLLKSTLSGSAEIDAYEMDLVREGRQTRHLVLNARKLDYADAENVRLVLAVADVTDARASEKIKDDLIREKAILLQEIQHRVANSLQIIASVLLQSARKVDSEETRTHLHEAHQRVMSVAAVQRQLAASQLSGVALRPYLADLCESIGASMIRDHKQLSLAVSADESVTTADVSVSLGLIVTELVINALKHAFPGRRTGKISVAYASDGPKWTLSVDDDGVGMPADAASLKPGLGTSIVEALAKQLHARVHVADANPGTAVSVVGG